MGKEALYAQERSEILLVLNGLWSFFRYRDFDRAQFQKEYSGAERADSFSSLHEEFWGFVEFYDFYELGEEADFSGNQKEVVLKELEVVLKGNSGAIEELYPKVSDFFVKSEKVASLRQAENRRIMDQKANAVSDVFLEYSSAFLAPFNAVQFLQGFMEKRVVYADTVEKVNAAMMVVLNTENKKFAYYEALTGCTQYGCVGKSRQSIVDGVPNLFLKYLSSNPDVLNMLYDNLGLISSYGEAFSLYEDKESLVEYLTNPLYLNLLSDTVRHQGLIETYLPEEVAAAIVSSSLSEKIRDFFPGENPFQGSGLVLDDSAKKQVIDRLVPDIGRKLSRVARCLIAMKVELTTCASILHSQNQMARKSSSPTSALEGGIFSVSGASKSEKRERAEEEISEAKRVKQPAAAESAQGGDSCIAQASAVSVLKK